MPRLLKKLRIRFKFNGVTTTRIIAHHPDGRIRYEKIKRDGLLHSLDKAAVVIYDDYGDVIIEKWCRKGRYHRENGPAIIVNDDNYCSKKWFTRGLLHRIKCAAIVLVKRSGTVVHEYWENGRAVWPYKRIYKNGASDAALLMGNPPIGHCKKISEGYKYGKKQTVYLVCPIDHIGGGINCSR